MNHMDSEQLNRILDIHKTQISNYVKNLAATIAMIVEDSDLCHHNMSELIQSITEMLIESTMEQISEQRLEVYTKHVEYEQTVINHIRDLVESHDNIITDIFSNPFIVIDGDNDNDDL